MTAFLSILLLIAPSTAPAVEALGVDLERAEYPYPVQRFAFEAQGMPVEMAYMDVPPTAESEPRGTVVLLHGKNFNGDYWGRTAGDLAAAGFRVVVPDQLGFGKSDKPVGHQYTFHGLADNTLALLDALGVDGFHVVGHSMGGMLAARLALQFPDRVGRLALVNPVGLEDYRRLVPYRGIDGWYEIERDHRDYESVKSYQLANYYDGEWDASYDRPVLLLVGQHASAGSETLKRVQAKTYDTIYAQPVVDELPDLTTPTLLIVGTRDRTALGKPLVDEATRAELGRYDRLGKSAAAAIPNATLVELDDVGHMPMLEAYDRYLPALTNFLTRTDSDGDDDEPE